jgi:ribonuclease P protein component
MIVRQHRFHGYNSLKPVYARGQSVRGGPLSLKYSSRGPDRPYRVAVVVSKKVHKSAVVRNRIRRRIYEIVRQSAPSIAPGTDLIFTAYDDQVAELEAAKLQQTVAQLLQKANQ